jgi:hypothetical protein
LLALLRATREHYDKPVAVPPEVNAVAGAKINLAFENTATNRFNVGQVTICNPLKRRRYFRRSMNVECAQPLREGASSRGIDLFPNVEHDSIITYTLGSTVDSGIGQLTIRRPAFTEMSVPRGSPPFGTWADGHAFSETRFAVAQLLNHRGS